MTAARKGLEMQTASPNWEDTEWSTANMLCFYARMKESQTAYGWLQNLFRRFMRENLMTVSFSSFGHRPETMTAQQTFDLRAEAYMNGYAYNHPEASAAELKAYWDNTIMGSNTIFSNEEFDGYKSGKTYDWLKQVTKTGVEHNHSVSFSKASDVSNLYVSLGYSGLDGVVKGTEQDKYYGRVNAESNIKPWLKIGTNTSYTYVRDEMPSGAVYNHALQKSKVCCAVIVSGR
jgi:TonB-dependent starch-binding outer membrane protein SusC